MDKILSEALSAFFVAFAIVFLPILGTMVGKLLVAVINSIKNPTIRHLAGDAVLWAEDKFGSKPGDEKLKFAVKFLMEKAKMTEEDAEKAVRAAYQNIFAQLPKEPVSSPPA